MTASGSMKPHWFQILLALAQGDRHGFGIQREVLLQTEDAMTLWPATLYRSLATLTSEGLIRPTEPPRDAPDDQRRDYYTLTELGRARLREEAQRMERWIDALRRAGLVEGESMP